MNDMYRILSQLEDSFLGYDRAFRHLESASRNQKEGFPPFNVIRDGNDFRIELAIAGFSEKDLEVNYEGGVLTITGDKERPTKTSQEFLHQAIAYRKFTRKFHLHESIEIKGASLQDGILTIHLLNVVPEHLQARKITIQKEIESVESEKKLLNE